MTTPPTDRDALLRELADTVRALDELPDDAFDERIDHRDRLHELRAALADPTEGRTRASLEGELDRLEAQLDRLHAGRIDVAGMASASGEGADVILSAMRLATQYDEAQGRGVLEDRIAAVRRALAALPTEEG